MCSKKELQVILKGVSSIYKAVYGECLVKILLYGSYARNDYNEQSDIDIAAIVVGDRVILQEKLKKVWDELDELEFKYGTIISPTVIPYDEYEQYKEDLPYYRNIETEGVLVVA